MIQYANAVNTTTPLSKDKKKYIQQVIGTLLYYGCTVDTTILVALSSLASAQSSPAEDTMKRTGHLLDYVAIHPNAIVSYAKSNMILSIHSDALYLSNPRDAATPVDISSSPTEPTTHPTMEPSSTHPKSSNQSCPLPPKPSSEHTT
jgi:hypothetical protein